MNTRNRVRSEFPLLTPQRPSFKATQAEIFQDLAQMADEPVKNILKRREALEKQPTKQPEKKPKNNEDASAILGFASFLNDVKNCKIKKPPSKAQKPQPSPKINPYLVAQIDKSPYAFMQQMHALSGNYMNMMTKMTMGNNFNHPRKVVVPPKELPASALHVKIAKFINEYQKKS